MRNTRNMRTSGHRKNASMRLARRVSSFVLIMATLALASCSTINPPVVVPHEGQGAFGALSNAAKLNGPDGWAWRISVPHNRLLLYYWITGDFGVGPGSAYMGATNETDLMTKIQTTSALYQQLDPAHPVVSAFDLTDPTIEPKDSYPPYDNHWADLSVIQHFITLSQQQHMLFFFDVNFSREPVEMILDRLWPYLQEPNVELALDNEYGYQWDNGCISAPGCDSEGRLYAKDINPVIDKLAALVATGKVPPKILVLYQWYGTALYDSQNIRLRPGVSVITCMDSVGDTSAKIAEYNVFDNLQQVQYPAYKSFPQNDTPPLTASQILALQPPPVMVAYQCGEDASVVPCPTD